MEEAADGVSLEVDSSANFPDRASDVLIVKHNIVEENSPWHVRDLTWKHEHRTSALQGIQLLCRSCDLSIPSDFRSDQVLIKDALASFASAGGDELSLPDVKYIYATQKK